MKAQVTSPSLPRLRWTREEVLQSGDEYIARLLESIRTAKRSIRFESYIFENDHTGNEVAQALEDASLRGVRVRVVVDGVGSPEWSKHFFARFSAAGVRARVYHPLPWDRASRRGRGFPFTLQKLGLFWVRLNRRNHRKTCVIDSREAYVGSANISDVHRKSQRGDRAWRDTIAQLEGPAIIWLIAAFEAGWTEPLHSMRWRRLIRRLTRGTGRASRGLVELNDTLGRRLRNARSFRLRIQAAEKTVWLANPYFVPSSLLIRSLKQAASQGVDVRILVPKNSDVVFMPWAARSFYGPLLKAGVRIFEYQPSMFHAKTAVIDDWSRVGSTNLNHRSLIHDLEVNVTLSAPNVRKSLERQFVIDQASSQEIQFDKWSRRPLWERFMGGTVLLLRRWI